MEETDLKGPFIEEDKKNSQYEHKQRLNITSHQETQIKTTTRDHDTSRDMAKI